MVKIYGASDDLIEVEGTTPGCDEYAPGKDDTGWVEFDSGDVFKVSYGTRGVWTIEHHVKPSGSRLKVEIEKAPEGEDPEPYTDTATVSGPIAWVDCWGTWPPSSDEVLGRIERKIEDGISHALAFKVFKAMYGERSWMK